MRLTLIFRKPTKGQYSIEKVFKPLIPVFEKSYDVSIVYLPYHTSGILNLLKNLFFLRKLRNADIYHITGDVQYAAVGLPSSKTILTIHDLNSIVGGKGFQNYIKKLLWFKLPLKRSKLVTCISQFTATELVNMFKVDKDKLRVVHNPIETIETTLSSSKSDTLNLLQIGTKKNKNIERLIVALEGISCKLQIVGKLSDDQKRLLSQHKIDFQNYINISDDEIHQLYQNCDIISFISTYEGFGMPILEAQSHGRPVLASNIDPIKEISGDAVEYIDPIDIGSIKSGIQRLIESKDLRNDLVSKGLENSLKFTPEKVAMKYVELYKEISKV